MYAPPMFPGYVDQSYFPTTFSSPSSPTDYSMPSGPGEITAPWSPSSPSAPYEPSASSMPTGPWGSENSATQTLSASGPDWFAFSGPTGPSGCTSPSGPTGFDGQSGPTNSTFYGDASGLTGPGGVSGVSGPSGDSGEPGPTIVPETSGPAGDSEPTETSQPTAPFVPSFRDSLPESWTARIDYESPFVDDLTAPPVIAADGYMLYSGPPKDGPKKKVLHTETTETAIGEIGECAAVRYTTYSLVTDWIALPCLAEQSLPHEAGTTIQRNFVYEWSTSRQFTYGIRPSFGAAPIVLQGVMSNSIAAGRSYGASLPVTCIIEQGYDYKFVAVVERKRLLVETQSSWIDTAGNHHHINNTETYAKLTSVDTAAGKVEGYELLTTRAYQTFRRKRDGQR